MFAARTRLLASRQTGAIVAFGDSITDGTQFTADATTDGRTTERDKKER